jgi:excisionase family DNA binding protein
MFVADSCGMPTEQQLLSTGDVARRLGVSRQHVVNMCDRGEIEHVFVGKHRRVPAHEVTRILGSDPVLTREQERSLWLHRALMASLMTSPDEVLDRARGNVQRWRAEHRSDGMTAHYLDEWERILDEGLAAVLDTLVSTTPEACELRQNSPFAGVLDDATRVQVLRSFEHYWEASAELRN